MLLVFILWLKRKHILINKMSPPAWKFWLKLKRAHFENIMYFTIRHQLKGHW